MSADTGGAAGMPWHDLHADVRDRHEINLMDLGLVSCATELSGDTMICTTRLRSDTRRRFWKLRAWLGLDERFRTFAFRIDENGRATDVFEHTAPRPMHTWGEAAQWHNHVVFTFMERARRTEGK